MAMTFFCVVTMIILSSVFYLCLASVTFAWPSPISNLGDEPPYQYATSSIEQSHLVDLWLKAIDINGAARYTPSSDNVYHLYTRQNPIISQPLLMGNQNFLQQSNFNSNKRTIVLIHGWRESAIADSNAVLVPAFLEAEDVNVIVVDWSKGASSLIYRIAIMNTISSGIAVAEFIDWINSETNSSPVQYHIVGHGYGGHQAGIVGRHVKGQITYITALNPSLIGWVTHFDKFNPNDGLYTEVIHTNYVLGYVADLGQVDFYLNGGISMPGCDSNECDHDRSYFYFAESLVSGGFTGRQCLNYYAAVFNTCELLPGRLQMGGLKPKLGSKGVYYLETNAAPPFSQD